MLIAIAICLLTLAALINSFHIWNVGKRLDELRYKVAEIDIVTRGR